MFNKSNSKKIEEVVKEFFEKTTFDAEVRVAETEEKVFSINVKMEEPQIFIGERGETLRETQQLLKMLLYKKLGEPLTIDFDINDYKKKKIEYLKEIARAAAEEVLFTKKEKELIPMSPYERRIVHVELQENPDVITESRGEEPERRIIIKPKNN